MHLRVHDEWSDLNISRIHKHNLLVVSFVHDLSPASVDLEWMVADISHGTVWHSFEMDFGVGSRFNISNNPVTGGEVTIGIEKSGSLGVVLRGIISETEIVLNISVHEMHGGLTEELAQLVMSVDHISEGDLINLGRSKSGLVSGNTGDHRQVEHQVQHSVTAIERIENTDGS